jgi:flagellar motor switch protein FliM
MTQEFLSQDEVDALLKGVADDIDGAAPPDAPAAAPRPVDLAAQERVVRSRMPALEQINERFVRNLRIGLLSYLRQAADISLGSLRTQKYQEFGTSLPAPSSINLTRVKPLRGTALVAFEPALIFMVIDSMFGGGCRFPARIDGRELTPTEQRIVRGLLNVIYDEYARAWEPVHPVQFEHVRGETDIQFANIAAPADIVVSFTLTLEMNGTGADIQMCLPYAMLEPIRERLSSSGSADPGHCDRRWLGLLTRQVQDAEVELAAALGGTDITLRQILRMKAGDVIPISIPERIEAVVDEIPVLECRYGVQNGHYALKVERFVVVDQQQASKQGQ